MIISYIYLYNGLQNTSNTSFTHRWRDAVYSQDVTHLFMDVFILLWFVVYTINFFPFIFLFVISYIFAKFEA